MRALFALTLCLSLIGVPVLAVPAMADDHECYPTSYPSVPGGAGPIHVAQGPNAGFILEAHTVVYAEQNNLDGLQRADYQVADETCGSGPDLYLAHFLLQRGNRYEWTAVPAATAGLVPGLHAAAYVDRYSFFFGNVILPCIVANSDTGNLNANPCQDAGGVFVSRLLVLLDSSEAPAAGLASVPVAQCNLYYTTMAAGLGVQHFTLPHPCP